MRGTLFLSIPVFLLGLYLYDTRGTAVVPPRSARTAVAVERISPALDPVPGVREINYFETQKQVDNWIGKYDRFAGIRRRLSGEHVTQGKHSMEIGWNVRRWGDLMLMHMPADWQHYRVIAFDLYNPESRSFELTFRAGDDFSPSRHNYRAAAYVRIVQVRPGENRFSFATADLAEALSLGSPRKIIHLLFRDASNRRFYLDNLRLER